MEFKPVKKYFYTSTSIIIDTLIRFAFDFSIWPVAICLIKNTVIRTGTWHQIAATAAPVHLPGSFAT
jgi:hypothetical protein